MTKIEFLPAAQFEYEKSADWYAEKSRVVAERFVTEVEAAIDALQQRPASYSRLDDTYRFYLVIRFPYYIAYRYTSNQVTIVAIRHAAQDQDAWKGR